VVTVTNDELFDQPVYNFTRQFPYMWEEIRIPVSYKADRLRAEAILLECARKVTERHLRRRRTPAREGSGGNA